MEQTIVLPKRIFKEDAVLIPRREYEEFLELKEYIKKIPDEEMTLEEKKAVAQARKEIKRGEYIQLKDLLKEYGMESNSSKKSSETN